MLTTGFIGLSVIVFVLLTLGLNHTLKKTYKEKDKIKKGWSIYFGTWAVWFLYLIVLSKYNILADLSLPPRFVYLLLLPMIVFMIIFTRKFKNHDLIKNLPQTWTASLQTYRIAVETLLHFTFIAGVLPASATFNGFNWDILVGISAPFIAYFTFYKKAIPPIIAKIWNIWGIAMIFVVVIVVATSNYFPQLWGSDYSLVSDDFFRFPYLLVAGFLAPVAIWIHVISLMQLSVKE